MVLPGYSNDGNVGLLGNMKLREPLPSTHDWAVFAVRIFFVFVVLISKRNFVILERGLEIVNLKLINRICTRILLIKVCSNIWLKATI